MAFLEILDLRNYLRNPPMCSSRSTSTAGIACGSIAHSHVLSWCISPKHSPAERGAAEWCHFEALGCRASGAWGLHETHDALVEGDGAGREVCGEGNRRRGVLRVVHGEMSVLVFCGEWWFRFSVLLYCVLCLPCNQDKDVHQQLCIAWKALFHYSPAFPSYVSNLFQCRHA
jgi:hypothetical protein